MQYAPVITRIYNVIFSLMFVRENDKAVSVFNTRLISKGCNICGAKLIKVDESMFFT